MQLSKRQRGDYNMNNSRQDIHNINFYIDNYMKILSMYIERLNAFGIRQLKVVVHYKNDTHNMYITKDYLSNEITGYDILVVAQSPSTRGSNMYRVGASKLRDRVAFEAELDNSTTGFKEDMTVHLDYNNMM